MTMRALIMNMSDYQPKLELQGRNIDGTFRQVDEMVLPDQEYRQVTLFKGQQALVVGPATVMIAHELGGSPEHVLKVETQGRDAEGRFTGEDTQHAKILRRGQTWVFHVGRGQQLQLHEKNAAAV